MSLSPPPASEKRQLFRTDCVGDFCETSTGVEKGPAEAPKDHRVEVIDADSPPLHREPEEK